MVPVLQFCPAVFIDVAIRFRLEEGKLVFMLRLENVAAIIQAQWDAVFKELSTMLPGALILHGNA